MNAIVVIGDIVRAFLALLVILEIDRITSRWDKLLVIGSDDTSWIEWVGSGLKRVGLSFGGIERSGLALSRIGSWDPEFSDNHSTDSQSTSLVRADVLDTSQSFDSIHSSNQGISIGEILGSSSERQRDDSDEGRGKDRNGGSDGVCSNGERDVIGETSRGDDNDGDNNSTTEQEVGELVKSASQLRISIGDRDRSLHLERGSVGDTKKDFTLVPELGETSLGPLSLGVERLGDTTNLRLHTSVDDDDSSSTFGDLRS